MSPRPRHGQAHGEGRLLGILLTLVAVLTAAFVATFTVHTWVRPLPTELVRLFALNNESSLGTWLSVVLMAVAGVLALVAAWAAPDRAERWGWLAVGGLMMLLSIDDKVQLHERLPDYLGIERGSMATHEWLLPGVALLGAALVAVVLLARHLPRRSLRGLLVALDLFIGGAVVMEGLSGVLIRGTEQVSDSLRLQVHLLTALEECLEMAAPAVAVVVIVHHLRATGVLRRRSAAMLSS